MDGLEITYGQARKVWANMAESKSRYRNAHNIPDKTEALIQGGDKIFRDGDRWFLWFYGYNASLKVQEMKKFLGID